MRKRVLSLLFVSAPVALAFACVEPPPKIAAIPPNGLSIRLHVFGASALDARRTFDAAKENNKNFRTVQEGGDGEVLVGLDNDSPKCVEPTALCSYKVAYRIRDTKGETLASGTTAVNASGERCGDLCERALNSVVVKVIELSAAALKGGAASAGDASLDPIEGGASASATPDASTETGDAGASVAESKPEPKAPEPKAHGKKKPPKVEPPPPPPPPKPEPQMCSVGHGLRLKSEEAERRAAQVEALKRLNVLDQGEYDCLRKAYLERL